MEYSAPPPEPLSDRLAPSASLSPDTPRGLADLGSWPPLRAVLVSAVLPNAILTLAAAAVHTPRALLNLDYFVLAALHAYLTRTVMVVLLSAALLVDIALTFAPVFHFGPGEILSAIEQIVNLRGRAIAIDLAFIALVVVFALAIVRLRTQAVLRGYALPALCALCMLTGFGADVVNGSNEIGWRPRTLIPVDIASSLFVSQTHDEVLVPMEGPMSAATDRLRTALADPVGMRDAPPKIVLVLVESMGFPHGASISAIFSSFLTDSMEQRYEVRTGFVPFVGATAEGELRELCGSRMNYRMAIDRNLDACLPNRLKAAGYETFTLHGYDGWFYQRRDWYPRIGFDHLQFREELLAEHSLPECGLLFRGICDKSFENLIRHELTEDPQRREFIYWVTLDSHFPIDPRPNPPAGSCSSLGAAGDERSVCVVWSILWPTLQEVASLANDPNVPPAWYIVVGDHSPPALTSDPHLYHQDRVPYIELRPREHVLPTDHTRNVE